jgi:GDP-L-fucose synthase
MSLMNKDSKIFVAGHKGLVGSAIVDTLTSQGYTNIIVKTRQELDLLSQSEVDSFFNYIRPDYVFDAAAKVGGIKANDTYPAEFIYQNIQIQTNLIHSSWKYGVKKFIFLGSVCIYPKFAEVPVKESSLLTGELEPTNDAYAVAKISGIKMLQAYYKQYGFDSVCLMPCNVYGPNDNFHPENSHVIAGMFNKFMDANNKSEVVFWGDGSPKREFIYSEDLAEACVFAANEFCAAEIVNIATGENVSILELSDMISTITGYSGAIYWDTTKPNGTPNRPLDCTLLRDKGWKPKYSLIQGLIKTYDWIV